MAEPFVFINTVALKDGKRDDWVRQFEEFSRFIAEHEPRLLHFETYLNEDGTEAAIFQIHPDADHMMFHMSLIAEHASEAHELLDYSRMSYQIYGTPNDTVLDRIKTFTDSGAPVSVKTPEAGFNRLPEP